MIKKSKEKVSIFGTDYKSPDRYINHYIKTTVMFIKAQKLFGDERVFGLLKKFFQTYKNTRNATTKDFLSLCDNEMKSFFEKYLYTDDWNKLDYKI